MDRGAWRARVHRVAKSWTRLKRLNTHLILGSQGRIKKSFFSVVSWIPFFVFCPFIEAEKEFIIMGFLKCLFQEKRNQGPISSVH